VLRVGWHTIGPIVVRVVADHATGAIVWYAPRRNSATLQGLDAFHVVRLGKPSVATNGTSMTARKPHKAARGRGRSCTSRARCAITATGSSPPSAAGSQTAASKEVVRFS
jgi:hypothetical protein